MERVLLYLRAAIEEGGVEVLAGPLPVVTGDSTQLYQLLFNLIHNAVTFRTGRRHGSDWIISVSDDGPGIDPEYLDTIVEPFRRLHGREVPGSGIGLALCKRVVENHNGRICVEGTSGHGATFIVALPAAPEAAATANPNPD